MIFLSSSELKQLYYQFADKVDHLNIVAYVRSPAAYLTSVFQQKVKGGSLKNFKLEDRYRNYENSFSKFDVVFGRDNVQLWKFDPRTFPDGCVVRDFCLRLGIDLPVERIVRANESPSRQIVSMLYMYRKLGENKDPARTAREKNRWLLRQLVGYFDDAVHDILLCFRGPHAVCLHIKMAHYLSGSGPTADTKGCIRSGGPCHIPRAPTPGTRCFASN